MTPLARLWAFLPSRRGLAPAALALAALVPFLPALRAGFLDWDDQYVLLENAAWRGFGWTQLRWMLTTTYNALYQPLTWLSYALDHRLWGLAPCGYHLTNLLLHALAAAAFYLMALRLLKAARGEESRGAALLAALLFAVHPLRVESVAWVTERGGLLAGLFGFLSLALYLDGRRRALSIAAFALSLLSKPSALMLPAVLLVLDRWPLRARRPLLEKTPYFLLSLAAALVAGGGKPQRPLEDFGLLERAAQACYTLAFGLAKTLLPTGLSPLYELPRTLDPWEPRFLASAAAVVGLSALAFALRRSRPALAAAWAAHVLLLLPVLGLLSYGNQLAADRYTYVACAGWPLLLAAALPARAAPLGGALALALGALSWRQTGVWHDSISLWSSAAEVRPETSLAHNNLGVELARAGRLEEAIPHFREAVKLNPGGLEPRNGLRSALTQRGLGLAAQGRDREAVRSLYQAVGATPWDPSARSDLGVLLEREGRRAEAAWMYRAALRLRPDHPQARENLARLMAR